MKEWSRRSAVLLLIGIISLTGLMKRHAGPDPKRHPFLIYTTGYLLVRVVDSNGSQGIYRFPDGTTAGDVNNMTAKGRGFFSLTKEVMSTRLKNGDVVEFRGKEGNISGITLKSMTAAERILLCIPLDPDSMSLEDWTALPGVGHFLAEATVADRQKNGYFCSFERVSRVPGIGSGRIQSLKKYFLSGN